MDDLISRKALLAEYDRVHIGEPGQARKLIEDAPTVDAAPVVRCKDCKFYELKGFPDGKMKMNCENSKGIWTNTKPDDFCSYGERRMIMDDMEIFRKLAQCEDKEQMQRCIDEYNESRKPQTNADRIRAMSDDELAKHFSGLICDINEGVEYHEAPSRWLEWLKEPANKQ